MKLRALVNRFTPILLVLFALSGCSALGKSTPAPLPTVVLGGNQISTEVSPQGIGGGVTASGVVVPSQEAQLAFTSGGNVQSLNVAVGDRVEAGQVLALLAGSEQLQAALSGAELEVLTAQQALQKLSDDLPEAQVAALQALNEARGALRDAQRRIDGFGVPSEPIDIQVARSNVALARHALDQAKKDFKPYENKPENDLKRAALLNKLSDAQKHYDEAVKQLNRFTGVTVPEFDIEQAQTELEIAQARLQLAEDEFELLRNGPHPEALELAQARLKTAQDQADAVRASLANLELKAPFAGTVSKVDIHSQEWVMPGQTILVLADLEDLQVETTDLSERDVPKIEIGQIVTVFVKALNQDVTGRVSEISPLADTLGGDVVYKTTIDLDTRPAGLRAGMSVEVQFGTGQ
jgi:multidrug efflux pump subunit AcrA (membrane-fusion protein)